MVVKSSTDCWTLMKLWNTHISLWRIQIRNFFLSWKWIKKFCKCLWRTFGKGLLMHVNIPLKADSSQKYLTLHPNWYIIYLELWQYFLISEKIQPPALEDYYYGLAAVFFVFQIYSNYLNNIKTQPDWQNFYPNL